MKLKIAMDNEPDRNPVANEHPMRGLIVAAAFLVVFAAVSSAAGCVAAITNAAAAAETFPATEEEYLARCEAGIQEKLLDYPDEERERMHDLLVSEASTAYFFQSLLVGLATSVVDRATEPAAPATSNSVTTAAASDAAARADEVQNPPSAAAATVDLDWRYGGFRGGGATEDARCRISQLKIGPSSLTIHWDTKIPADWKRGDSKKGPMIIIAAFYQSGDRWIGGKFDWIDESRSSRDLENIHSGYGGWDAAAWRAASRHAVCVVSADGAFRSNLLTD